MRRCVYTAIASHYNTLKPHPEVEGVDWVAFVDGDGLIGTYRGCGWDVRPISQFWNSEVGLSAHPRMRAKWFKVNVCAVLPEYDESVWVDGSVEVGNGSLVDAMLAPLEDWMPISALRHPERTCIYDEAVASMDMPKYRDEPLLQQVAWYWQTGHPRHYGLWAGTVIGRKHSDKTRHLMNEWWRHISAWSYQDQLSLPYVARLTHTAIHAPDIPLYGNDLFTVTHQPETL